MSNINKINLFRSFFFTLFLMIFTLHGFSQNRNEPEIITDPSLDLGIYLSNNLTVTAEFKNFKDWRTNLKVYLNSKLLENEKIQFPPGSNSIIFSVQLNNGVNHIFISSGECNKTLRVTYHHLGDEMNSENISETVSTNVLGNENQVTKDSILIAIGKKIETLNTKIEILAQNNLSTMEELNQEVSTYKSKVEELTARNSSIESQLRVLEDEKKVKDQIIIKFNEEVMRLKDTPLTSMDIEYLKYLKTQLKDQNDESTIGILIKQKESFDAANKCLSMPYQKSVVENAIALLEGAFQDVSNNEKIEYEKLKRKLENYCIFNNNFIDDVKKIEILSFEQQIDFAKSYMGKYYNYPYLTQAFVSFKDSGIKLPSLSSSSCN